MSDMKMKVNEWTPIKDAEPEGYWEDMCLDSAHFLYQLKYREGDETQEKRDKIVILNLETDKLKEYGYYDYTSELKDLPKDIVPIAIRELYLPEDEGWISVKEQLPPEDKTVQVVFLGYWDDKPYSDMMARWHDGKWSEVFPTSIEKLQVPVICWRDLV